MIEKLLDLGFLHTQERNHFWLHSYEKFFKA